ncbi:PfaD family polyunsaturated fatty acid/polyketide biosynthesis protein [Actinocrispum wychmicini]|uniref:PfaD family protein n=1 Tax=Actinocrispum wychmicini TaxID=1213861 RepID=A0A4R2JUC2_9PSEU|nr:PfaD family polyunsaturated fatty acid/polyketide biosynthesis protein [Actinocrispum wychmicini]TCO60619.1 PfaD family protein [Actinocrispum wychmicini]
MTRTTAAAVRTDVDGIRHVLGRLELPCYVVETGGGVGLATEQPSGARVIAAVGPLPPGRLGSAAFRARHRVGHAYLGGAMAAGIASEEMVAALARNGFLGSFGAAGLLPERVDRALRRFAAEIPGTPFAANLIHSPSEQALERSAVELYLRHGVRCVEASAFLDLTPNVVRYRVAGLSRAGDGSVTAANRIIAKVSRPEVAAKFLRPAPESVVAGLLADGLITAEQAALARGVPMADDITVEADSGGHTDRRPLVALFPTIARLRDTVQRELRYPTPVGLGAAGGIGTPQAAAAAFALGADYVVTGSVNQSCVEAGTSDAVRQLLCAAGIADCEMAPAADMFELGVDLQVLKKGTLFPMRAKQLYELYRRHDGLDALPAADRDKLERQVLRHPIEHVWAQVVEYFDRRDPDQVRRAATDPKRRMALVFRWYLGMSSRWATSGETDRAGDYQIWCGPAMGSFNEWARGTYLAAPENRRVAEVATHLMRGAAFVTRVQQLALAGVRLPAACRDYQPVPSTDGSRR